MRFGSIRLALMIGLTTSALGITPAVAQVPDEAIGARLSPILLLTRPDIREELAITAEQAGAVDHAIAESLARAAAIRGRSGPDAVAARREVDEAAQRRIEELLSVEQRARLDQVDLQWQGASALISRPTIAASLEVTEDQQRQIVETLSRGAGPGEGPIQAHRRMQRDAVSVLTDDQKLRWLAMVGPPFEPAPVRQARAGTPGG